MLKIANYFFTLPFIARYRFRCLYSKPIEHLRLNTKLVLNELLEEDLRKALTAKECGARVLWAPEGAGKTTYIRHVLRSLQKEGKIQGSIIITASQTDMSPSAWLQSMISDNLPGNLLRDGSTFSTLLNENPVYSYESPYSTITPVVIVIDQIENIRRTDEMNKLIKSLAEDASLRKTHNILIKTNNAAYARGLIEVNGRTKIRSIGDVGRYKWNETHISTWLNNNKEGISIEKKRLLLTTGPIAGTPAFLLDNMSDETSLTMLKTYADYSKSLWDAGIEVMRKGIYTK